MASSCLYGSASAVFLFVLLCNTRGSGVTAQQDPLLPYCKSVGGGSNYFDINFCMDALSADPRSRSPNVGGFADLASISVDLLTAKASSTAAKIRGLIGGGSDPAAKRCLSSCQALYGGVLERQAGCAAAIKAHKFGEAVSSLGKSASAAKQCEDGFGKSGVASPLTAEDDYAFKIAKLAEAFLTY